MSVKYHINPETGRANQCTATVQSCKFAVDGQVPEHYETKDEAKRAYEKEAGAEFGETTSLKKQKPKKEKIEKFSTKPPKTVFEHDETLDKYFNENIAKDKTFDVYELTEQQAKYTPKQGQSFEVELDPMESEDHDKETWTLVDEEKMSWEITRTNEVDPSQNITENLESDWRSVVNTEGPFYYVGTETKLSGYDKGQKTLF